MQTKIERLKNPVLMEWLFQAIFFMATLQNSRLLSTQCLHVVLETVQKI